MSSFDGGERLGFVVGAIVVAGALAFTFRVARSRARAPVREPAAELLVPHASDALHLDGELDEPSWRAAARSGAFLAPNGKEATPYSDARFTWTDDALRIGLYAADEDIVSADSFHVVLEVDGVERTLDVSPGCKLNDHGWSSGARLACDSDGTLDVPGDRDEEWVVEMEVPRAKLGDDVTVSVKRCDVGSGGPSAQPCGELHPTHLALRR